MPANTIPSDDRHIPDWALLATAFITGACVLIIELMGTRVLAPYFGSGIYTWSALIAVTLAALAAGYAFGGRLADRLPRAGILYNICLAAGLWTLSTPMLARMLLPITIEISDMRTGVLLSSLLLYFPNLFLLGAVGPFVIRLMTPRREAVGSVSGRVFAVSTIGSLLGALGTGFMLMPNYGVLAIFAFCGSLLLALALIGNFRPRFIGYALILAALVVSLLIVTSRKPDPESSLQILEQTPSFYGQLHVVLRHDEKSLLVDGIGQNYIYDDGSYVTPYIDFLAALPRINRPQSVTGDRAVVIGLGAGQLPMLLQQAGLAVEAVEIDPKIGALAREYFGFALPPDQLHFMDGRLFLLRSPCCYEYIVIDAFSAEQVAAHLVSMEALVEASARMTDTGILAVNMTSVMPAGDIAALQHTLKTVFPHVRSFTADRGQALQSFIFLASRSPIHLSTANAGLAARPLSDVELFLAGEMPTLESGILLTDDFNPINYQRRQVQLLWRKAMIEHFGETYPDWLLL